MSLLNDREDCYKRLDELEEVCNTCITITYNKQMYGEDVANEYCVEKCPLAIHFQEIGKRLIADTKKKRESGNE